MKHYVYRITNIKLNKHYYGTRTSKKNIPEKDIGYIYFSSSHDEEFIKDQKENPQDYKYKVIKKFKTRKEAIELEIKLHNKFNVGINESFYNRSKQSSIRFDTTGIKQNRTKEWQNKLNNTYNNLSDETKKIRNNKIRLAKKGKKLSEETISKIKIGKIKSKELNPNQGCKIVNIFNRDNKLEYVSEGNFKKFCKVNNLPYTAFMTSLKEDILVYEKAKNRPSVVSNLKNKGLYYKWYGYKIKYV